MNQNLSYYTFLFTLILICIGCGKTTKNNSSEISKDSITQSIEPAKQQEREPSKIETDFIWVSCYPNEKRFDGKKRLLRTKSDSKIVTLIEKNKQYELDGKHKVYAIFCTYFVDETGEVYDSHASAANISIARFVWNVDKWELEKFIEDWKKDVGAWGQGPEWTFKTQEGREIFGMKWMYGNHGNFDEYNDFYDVETLEKVKLQKGTKFQENATEMVFVEYSEGDYPHLIFKEVQTGKEYDFRFLDDNNLNGLKLLIDDNNAAFGYKANPKYLKKRFTVSMVIKSVKDADLDGNAVKTKAPCIKTITEVQ